MSILLIINPIAGDKDKGLFLKNAKHLMKQYSVDYEVFFTTGVKDYEKVEKHINKNTPEKVIVVGGDGTLNIFLKSFIAYDLKVGFIPMGSANGMAVELNLKESPKVLFKRYLNSKVTKQFDVLCINDTYLLLHLGDVGANANLVANYDKDDSRGMLTYAKHFWSEFQNMKGFKFEIQTDEMDYERKGVMLAICNGRAFGTGIALNTTGKMDDGYFELVIVKAIDFFDVLKAAMSKFDDSLELDYLETITAKSAFIKFKEPRLLQLDGEVIGKFLNLKIDVLPKAISFLQ